MSNIEDDIKLLEEMKRNCFNADKNNYQDEKRYNKGLAIENVLADRERLIKENEELKRYDYRKIKIDEKDKIKSPSFTKEQADWMNFGIALYTSFDEIYNYKSEEDNI